MGEYNFEKDLDEEAPKTLKFKKRFANRMLNQCDALQ
jgi:hypothetical protein